jgi:hypothetical protein
MYFDRSLMKARAGVGLLFISHLGVHMRYAIRLHFTASNNVAEYEALVNGLHFAIELGVRCNTPGVYQQLSSGVKLKHDRLVEMTMPKLNLWK